MHVVMWDLFGASVPSGEQSHHFEYPKETIQIGPSRWNQVLPRIILMYTKASGAAHLHHKDKAVHSFSDRQS